MQFNFTNGENDEVKQEINKGNDEVYSNISRITLHFVWIKANSFVFHQTVLANL